MALLSLSNFLLLWHWLQIRKGGLTKLLIEDASKLHHGKSLHWSFVLFDMLAPRHCSNKQQTSIGFAAWLSSGIESCNIHADVVGMVGCQRLNFPKILLNGMRLEKRSSWLLWNSLTFYIFIDSGVAVFCVHTLCDYLIVFLVSLFLLFYKFECIKIFEMAYW